MQFAAKPTPPWLAFVGWLALPFISSVVGAVFRPDAWYRGLDKAPWNPPDWVFAPAWTTLYILMGVAAWLVWREGGWARQRRPLAIFVVQLVVNALWMPLFFGLHNPALALIDILLLVVLIIATMRMFFAVSRAAGWLLAPYLAWVLYATSLNAAIWHLN